MPRKKAEETVKTQIIDTASTETIAEDIVDQIIEAVDYVRTEVEIEKEDTTEIEEKVNEKIAEITEFANEVVKIEEEKDKFAKKVEEAKSSEEIKELINDELKKNKETEEKAKKALNNKKVILNFTNYWNGVDTGLY